MGRLTGIETVLLDLDGTLYVGSQVVNGAPEAVRWLRDQGLTVRFCTNTDSVTPAALADRPLKEPTGSRRVPPWRDDYVDDLAELVDRAVDVAPLPSHLHVVSSTGQRSRQRAGTAGRPRPAAA